MTPVFDGLPEFIEARLDEDGDLARGLLGAHPGPWRVGLPSDVRDCAGEVVVADEYHWSPMPHIARHDPARVLREVAAKRLMVRLHDREHDCPVIVPVPDPSAFEEGMYISTEHIDGEDPEVSPCTTMRAIAAAWNDHPDYRPEWKP